MVWGYLICGVYMRRTPVGCLPRSLYIVWSGYGKAHRLGWALCQVWCGGVLLSHTLSGAVPLPCQVLASGFGMGPGVSPGPWPPQIFNCPSPPFLGVRVVWLFGDRWVDATRVCVRDCRPSVWLVCLA